MELLGLCSSFNENKTRNSMCEVTRTPSHMSRSSLYWLRRKIMCKIIICSGYRGLVIVALQLLPCSLPSEMLTKLYCRKHPKFHFVLSNRGHHTEIAEATYYQEYLPFCYMITLILTINLMPWLQFETSKFDDCDGLESETFFFGKAISV